MFGGICGVVVPFSASAEKCSAQKDALGATLGVHVSFANTGSIHK